MTACVTLPIATHGPAVGRLALADPWINGVSWVMGASGRGGEGDILYRLRHQRNNQLGYGGGAGRDLLRLWRLNNNPLNVL